ncbi:alkaline phosphatase, partial [Lysobacter sp. 2RAB21]
IEKGRPDLTNVDTQAPDYMQEALVPTSNETHGGDDVGIWARGPGSAAVRGSVEQNTIYHFMLQSMPKLRAALCAKGDCDANKVPVMLPKVEDFKKN